MTKGLRCMRVDLREHGEHSTTADIWPQRTNSYSLENDRLMPGRPLTAVTAMNLILQEGVAGIDLAVSKTNCPTKSRVRGASDKDHHPDGAPNETVALSGAESSESCKICENATCSICRRRCRDVPVELFCGACDGLIKNNGEYSGCPLAPQKLIPCMFRCWCRQGEVPGIYCDLLNTIETGHVKRNVLNRCCPVDRRPEHAGFCTILDTASALCIEGRSAVSYDLSTPWSWAARGHISGYAESQTWSVHP